MAHIDDRGHEKAELVMFDPQAPNFQVIQANLNHSWSFSGISQKYVVLKDSYVFCV